MTRECATGPEALIMGAAKVSQLDVRVVRLHPMRVASVRVVSESPEAEAFGKLRAWAEPKGLLADTEHHPVYGFNNPSPTHNAKEYGYEFWIKVDSDTASEGEIAVRDFVGGLYAVTSCKLADDPKGSVMEVWQQLLAWVHESPYQWRETHELEGLRDPNAEGQNLVLDLYLPIEG